jgi:hypothetical protein
VAGGQIAPAWDLAAVVTGSDGSYSLGAVANPPSTPYALNLSADGFLTRKQFVAWQAGARGGITLDIIREAAPFSLEFYRQLVRGTYDNDGPWPVLRWTQPPKFYVKTVDQAGRPIEPEVLVIVLDALARSVPLYTGGVYSAAIETGTGVRPEAAGWINVDMVRDPDERSTCGTSFVGRDPGLITLNSDVCSCGSNKIPGALVMHEVGHALGFFHVSDRESVMYPFFPGSCPAGAPSADERYHSAIAYARPRGNTDPDDDPTSGAMLSPFAVSGPTGRVKN